MDSEIIQTQLEGCPGPFFKEGILRDLQNESLVVEPTHLKNMSQNGFIFPNFRGENEKYLSYHHLVNLAVSYLAPIVVFQRCNDSPRQLP